jgi:hypothetical protein
MCNTVGTFPTSFSNLSCYGRCPQDFRLRHVCQYNAGVPITFGDGTNVYNILNFLLLKVKKTDMKMTQILSVKF